MSLASLPAFDATQFRFPRGEDAFKDQWGDAYSLVMGAQSQGILDAPVTLLTRGTQPGEPGAGIESIPGVSALNPVRFKVIAEQLWLLGYLENRPVPENTGNIQSTPEFKKGVARFQQEAGLTTDGWSGNQTWKAISTLVNFETKTKVGRWKRRDGVFYRAFRRAVQLRLWTYGLAGKKPGPEFNAIPTGNLERLKKVLWSLSIIDHYNEKISREALFSILFDPDRLVAAAGYFKPIKKPFAGPSDTFRDKIHDMEEHKSILKIKRRFLVNLAKTELWLLGSDIQIDGEDDYPVEGLGVKRTGGFFSKSATDKEISEYLLEYWRKLSILGEMDARKIAKSITPSLFRSFVKPDEINAPGLSAFSEADYSKKLVDEFEKDSDTQALIAKSYAEGKGLGMKLWDGLKRIWAWIKKGVKKILSFGKNIFRAFYRFSMKGFAIVKMGFSVFATSMDQYVTGRLEMDNDKAVMVTIKRDMDYQILISDTASSQDLIAAKRSVQRFGSMFLFSCKIIGFFVDILKTAARGLVGWAKLLMVLVTGYRELVPAYRELIRLV